MITDRFLDQQLDQDQIEVALEAIAAILKVQDLVNFAYLHGSVLRFQSAKQSILPHDIDVAIHLAGGDWVKVELDLQFEFYRRTGLCPEVLDVHTLNNAPLSVRMEIISRGRLLFCRDILQHADFLEKTSNLYRRLAGFFEAAYA